jgi:DNA repair exonuclease SbcCD ATPase subunit
MIRITIHSFRGLGSTKEDPNPKVFTFNRGLNLLKGESGKGKSTIINAFRWCLYKEPMTGNNSLLKNMISKTPKVTVEFKTNGLDFTITRSSSPNMVEIRHHDHGQEQLLTNEEAEAYVEKVFGKEHYWRTCCFIQQGYHNPILEVMSAAEKREVFQTMTTNSLNNKLIVDIPMDVMRTRIADMRKQLESDEKVKEGVLKTMEEHYRKMSLEVSQPQFDKPYAETDVYEEGWNIPITKIMTELQTLSVGEKSLEDIKQQTAEMEAKLNSIHQTSLEIQTRRNAFEAIIERSQKQLLEHAHAYQAAMDLGQQYPLVIQSKKWLDSQTMREYLERIISTYAFVNGCIEYFRLRGVFGTGADRWNIYGNLLEEYAVQLPNYREYLTNKAAKTQLTAQYAKMKAALNAMEEKSAQLFIGNPWLEGESNHQEYRTQLSNQLKSTDGQVVSCPSCKKHLLVRTIGNHLQSCLFDRQESVEIFRKTIQSRIMVLDQAIAIHRQIQDQEDQLHALEDRIDNVILDERFAISNDKLQYMENHTAELLRQWQTLRKLVPVTVLENVSKYMVGAFLSDVQKVMKSMRNLLHRDMVTELTNDIEQAKTDISLLNLHAQQEEKAMEKNLIEEIHSRKQTLLKVQRRNELLQKLRTSFANLNVDQLLREPDYLDFLADLHTYKKELRLYEKQTEKRNSYNYEITAAQNEMTDIRKKINHLLELNKIMDETEEEIFEHTISIMVTKINELLENFFDQNPPKLIVKNETKKTSKTSRDIQFVFSTTDQQADSARGISTFSGGEADRLSLAFTCAVAEFSECPLLFLDECISSLDVELRDRVIRTLRTVVKNKFVIVVCHDTLDGLFDKIVSV